MTPNNIKNFKSWWRRINTEHFLVFWLLGITAMSLLMLLSYVTAYGMQGNDEGIMFVINEGLAIGRQTMPFVGGLFLFVVGVMLFQTQLGVMDSTSRIMAENLAIKLLQRKNHKKINLSKIYFSFVWAQITFGIILFLFNITDPKMLIVLGAVINAFAMFVHVGLTYRLNMRELPKEFRPRVWRRAIIWIVFAFFGVFSAFTFISKIF